MWARNLIGSLLNFLFGDRTTKQVRSTTNYLTTNHYLHVDDDSRDVTTYFADGRRRIDYVIVYAHKLKENILKHFIVRPRADAGELRDTFVDNLHSSGIETETMAIDTGSHLITFINVHVPWGLLTKYAELLNFKVPFRDVDEDPMPYHWSYAILNACKLRCFNTDVPEKPRYFTADFTHDKIGRYIGSKNKQTFFQTVQRNRVAYEILQETLYGKEERDKGLDRLLKEDVFTDAFPPHDGPHKMDDTEDTMNQRQTLFYYWARWTLMCKYQPLDEIHVYFGEKIAFYFALLGFYTSWLVPLAIVGLFVFIYGVTTVTTSATILDICTVPLDKYSVNIRRTMVKIDPQVQDYFRLGPRGGARANQTETPIDYNRMCPLCNDCPYWDLNKSCLNFALAYVTDHSGAVFYAFFTSLWAVFLLQYWTRLRNRLAYSWNCYDIVVEEERPRARYLAEAPTTRVNQVTGQEEPAYPRGTSATRAAVTTSFLALMVIAAAIFFIAVMLYRVLVSSAIMKMHEMVHFAEYMAVSTGLLLHFCVVKLLNIVYAWIAYRLTDWEVHRTQTQYENHLSIKIFLFDTINNYAPKFYIAFIKGRFVGYPGHYNSFLGARLEKCDNDNCSSELALNIAIFFIGNLIVNNISHIAWPLLKNWYFKKSRKIRRFLESVNFTPQWLDDYCKTHPYVVWKDYMALATQFGYVTIFVAAFPIAPLLALLNNCIEIRLNAKKYLIYSRRALAQRVSDIGIWYPVLKVIVYISVITNGFIIAFTLDFLPKILYMYEMGSWDLRGYVSFSLAYSEELSCRYHDFRDDNGKYTPFYWKLLFVRVMFVFVFEHFIFLVMHLAAVLIPEMPEDVDIARKRERYLAKQAFTQSQY